MILNFGLLMIFSNTTGTVSIVKKPYTKSVLYDTLKPSTEH
jgi:hypothetical protein